MIGIETESGDRVKGKKKHQVAFKICTFHTSLFFLTQLFSLSRRDLSLHSSFLVGGIPTPLKNMSSSVGINIFPYNIWKVINSMVPVTTNQLWYWY